MLVCVLGGVDLDTPESEMVERVEIDLAKQQFRGLEFENWFYVFIQVSLLRLG
jgi:hypothetical protein